ncbi:MAG: tyrosine--tRNA ligase [Chloroflexi bacterium]|nr:tyrosine--tRNA ligase [Chloroflexota bacterium]
MDKDQLSHLLSRGVAEVIIREEMDQLLEAGKPLRLKMGFDPSRSDIHLGHAVGLRKLRQFQELGHRVILIVGDWTAQIGDPSGQSATRPMLSAEEVKDNAQTYLDQFFKVVDRDKTEVRWQSEWFGKFGLADIIKLTSRFTVAQLLARDDFSKRYAANRPIAITELLYPLLQAYDSVIIEADVEFGGTDQKFNLLLGRELQSMMGQRPQQCLMVPILVGTDGVLRMSKSLDNYIGIDEPPKDTYFKVMRLKDDLMMDYFELVTDVPGPELDEMRQALETRSVNPMEIKKRLAREIVAQFHGLKASTKAEADFGRIVQRKEAPDHLIEFCVPFSHPDAGPNPDYELVFPSTTQAGFIAPGASLDNLPKQTRYLINIPVLLVRAEVVSSKAEGKRLIRGGGVRVDGGTLDREYIRLAEPYEEKPERARYGPPEKIYADSLIKAGKRHTIRIVDSRKKESN